MSGMQRLSGTRLSGSSLSGSYDDDVRMMERMLDARSGNKGGQPAFQALKFGSGDDEIKTQAGNAEKKNLRRSSGSGSSMPPHAEGKPPLAPSVSSGTPPSQPVVITVSSASGASASAAASTPASAAPQQQQGGAGKQQQQQQKQKQQQQQKQKQGGDGNKGKQQQKDGDAVLSSSPSGLETSGSSADGSNKQKNRKQSVSQPGGANASGGAGGSGGSGSAQASLGSSGGKGSKPTQYDDPKQRQKAQKKQILSLELSTKQVPLFAHMPQYERPKVSITERLITTAAANPTAAHVNIHPKIIRLGLKYVNRQLQGSNARTIGMLKAFKHVIQDHENTSGKAFAIDLDLKLRPVIQFLIDCRPLAVGMGNAIKYVKRQVGTTLSMTDTDAKAFMIAEIKRYIQERIVVADEAIMAITADQIQNGDVILTYASSHVVQESFKAAKEQGKNFQVIIVDARPQYEGKTLMRRLVAAGIQCSYVLLNAVSYIIKGVDKVIMGAHALLSNGQVYSRCGTAVVSMMAHAHNIPVLICCETYKFADRVQVDAISQNELADPDALVTGPVDDSPAAAETANKLKEWKSNDSLKLLNLVYDLTPMQFVSMVISEVGMIPPTSVPVVIREYQLRTQDQIAQDRAFY